MNSERFVVVGLARVRADWFTRTSAWANSAAVPLEFVKCVSASEVRARIGGGRSISALLVDGGVQGLDRDLIDTVQSVGAATIVVDDAGASRDWTGIGAAAVLDRQFDRHDLLGCLTENAATIRSAVAPKGPEVDSPSGQGGREVAAWRAPLVAVTGTTGSGTSTVAMACAQALGTFPANRGSVLLADLCLRGDLALYHDPGDVVPGISEVVDAHRRDVLTPTQVRELCWQVDERGYDVLLGLRRPRDWTALRSRSVAAAVDSLRSAYRAVVADVDADLEGEAETGSVDIEERNLLARHATSVADVVVVVGTADLRGLHGVVRLQRDLLGHGVSADAVITVINRTARSPRHRSELCTALAELGSDDFAASPIFLPERRSVEAVHRAGSRLPSTLSAPLGAALDVVLERVGHSERATHDSVDTAEPMAV